MASALHTERLQLRDHRGLGLWLGFYILVVAIIMLEIVLKETGCVCVCVCLQYNVNYREWYELEAEAEFLNSRLSNSLLLSVI